jgi:hypothetical protein
MMLDRAVMDASVKLAVLVVGVVSVVVVGLLVVIVNYLAQCLLVSYLCLIAILGPISQMTASPAYSIRIYSYS